ncbi:MAG TPA: glucose 1-dehydrogenase [Methylomirabilota bacterium]|jgi:NAD(P)-dependent dehydrogenase (short-subunit alcohol dehydrogenase family)|nr:glucose 1-dehydrogenase [Methylomirabilota bacterium]
MTETPSGLSAFSLAGRTALVTGAGQGIGRVLALGLAQAGARVAVTDVNGETVAHVADELRAAKAEAAHRVLDVARSEDIEPAVAWAERELGPIDVLVNNAGIRERVFDSFAITAADFDQILAVNLRGPFLLCQAVGRRLAERGGGGSIINIASQLGLVGMAGRPAYTASKGGLINLTRTLALEWAPRRIRVNAIAPGPIRTPHTQARVSDPATNARYQDATPLGAWKEPEELVGAAVYLASDASTWVTGHVLVVDGGFTAR